MRLVYFLNAPILLYRSLPKTEANFQEMSLTLGALIYKYIGGVKMERALASFRIIFILSSAILVNAISLSLSLALRRSFFLVLSAVWHELKVLSFLFSTSVTPSPPRQRSSNFGRSHYYPLARSRFPSPATVAVRPLRETLFIFNLNILSC